jgi:mannose-6-phosphate isomerase-like protein (cupin superfamily)
VLQVLEDDLGPFPRITGSGFRPFFNQATGEWIEFTAVAEDSDGRLIRFSWRSVPGGVMTEHVHPRQEERFIVTSGEARFTLDGEELMARAGDTVVVPAGVRHSEGNPGRAEVRAIVELRPALRSKEFHEAVAGLAAAADGAGPSQPSLSRKALPLGCYGMIRNGWARGAFLSQARRPSSTRSSAASTQERRAW